MAKVALNDDNLDKVVGGFMSFDYPTQVMTYTHEDGTVTTHQILDFDKAWERCNELHGRNVREDDILADMLNKGYIG